MLSKKVDGCIEVASLLARLSDSEVVEKSHLVVAVLGAPSVIRLFFDAGIDHGDVYSRALHHLVNGRISFTPSLKRVLPLSEQCKRVISTAVYRAQIDGYRDIEPVDILDQLLRNCSVELTGCESKRLRTEIQRRSVIY